MYLHGMVGGPGSIREKIIPGLIPFIGIKAAPGVF